MQKINRKIVLIGSGAVGTSFLYSAINQGLASEYVLIDAFPNAALGNALDLADTAATVPTAFSSIKAGDYSDIHDADIIVITAGRPQLKKADGTLETRLEIAAANAKIMTEIATNVRNSGFKGITVIASNPVDVLTRVYQEVTGFEPSKVIGSGTTLDSSRLRRLVGEKLGVNAQGVNAYIIGEHGDSSVAV
jgi:L-lactate dehydrogenase